MVQYQLIILVKIMMFNIVLLRFVLMEDMKFIGFLNVGLVGFNARLLKVSLKIIPIV